MLGVMHAYQHLIVGYYYRKGSFEWWLDPNKLGLLKFEDVNKLVIGTFMFRWYHDEVPSMYHDYFD